MTSLWFPSTYSYSSHRCIVPVVLDPTGIGVSVQAVIDTGAWTTVFDKALASLVGIPDITAGREIGGTAANGEEATGYQFDVPLGILGHRLIVPVAFFPGWPIGVPNLLGMEGFLNRVGTMAFNHQNHLMYHE